MRHVTEVDTDGSTLEEDAVLVDGHPLDAPGRCDAGSLRDDASLVVSLVTDEEGSTF